MFVPCKECPEDDRFVGCHGICRDYIAFRILKDAENKARCTEFNKNGIMVESYARHAKRNNNKNRVCKTHMK